jgi:hypothetical protein
MKNMALVIGLAGVVFVSSNVCLANGAPAVPPVKKDSGHAAPTPGTKQATPNYSSPALPKPGLPVNAGKSRGTGAIGGASGRKDGKLNGTEIKRHP